MDWLPSDPYHLVCLIFAIGMLLWDTVEVGRNDAANLVNAVFGARVLERRMAITLAGLAVVAGAVLSSDVIDTARKGIFNPTLLTGATPTDALNAALAIYTSVYVVDTVLLYGYSAFGMPVSTTACLVFELLGAAIAVQWEIVRWNKAGTVIMGIVCSIILAGIGAFLIQRAVRGAIRDRGDRLDTLLLHGGWVGGGLMAGLCYFLLLKGMKAVPAVIALKAWLKEADVAAAVVLFVLWGTFALLIHGVLVVWRDRAARLLFPVLAVLGMVAMAFAFGQNDLANCAAPGLATYRLLEHGDVTIASEAKIPQFMLLICGLLLFAGMTTANAERVTKAAVRTGSMGDRVKLYAPAWCIFLASKLLLLRGSAPALAPRQTISVGGKTMHYDALRATVIMSVSASVIATASSLGLPVSTTYVAFAAVVATGMADRIFQRGDAELKLGRAIWVVTSWFLAAFIAAASTALVARVILHLQIVGIVVCLGANLLLRQFLKNRADAHEQRVAEEARERAYPEQFALEDEEM
jgi:phosphate/sulfate permease